MKQCAICGKPTKAKTDMCKECRVDSITKYVGILMNLAMQSKTNEPQDESQGFKTKRIRIGDNHDTKEFIDYLEKYLIERDIEIPVKNPLR